MSIRPLNELMAKKAKDELFEDPKNIARDLQAIKDWLAKQPHLNVRMDDQWLVAFLRGSKHSLERTKEKIDLFHTMRSLAPELTMSSDPMEPMAQEILKLGVLVKLPNTVTPDGPIVLLGRFGIYDPSVLPPEQVIRITGMLGRMWMMENDQFVVAGVTVIVDFAGVGTGHFLGMSPSNMKKMTMATQDASPTRQKGAYYVNIPSIMEKMMEFAKPFMTEKVKSRMHLYSNKEELLKIFPKSILPTEYGGDAGPIQKYIDEAKSQVESYRDWLIEDMQYKSNESKRVGTPKTSETMFGIEGSFRQLNVD